MNFNIIKNQLPKTAKYCPNPIVKYGIPTYADARANPKVRDTLAYQQFWEEQVHYILNGYTTGGMTIPGRYYKFINFDRAQTPKGVGPMEIHDFQLDYAYWIEHLKSPGVRMNAYIPKARRKTLSVMTCGMVIDYGIRFLPNYHAAVVAGLDEYAQDFIAKWRYVDMHMQPEFRIHKLKNNDDEIIAGWKENMIEGWSDAGTMNTIYILTVNNNPNVLKGKFLHDIVYEESGENELLLETIKASEECLKLGSVQYGTSWIYGTGGNMEKGSKGFKEVHQRPKVYNIQEWFVPGYVFYEPAYAGATNEHNQIVEDIPNLLRLKPYERVGMSDFERAKELIKKRKAELLAEGDMDKYIHYCQENPLEINEIFRRSSANNFDALKINDQLYKIESDKKNYNRYHLDYKKNPDNGAILTPLQIEIRPAKTTDPEWECVYILNDGHPIQGYRDLDVAGIDSYDQNNAKTSKSLGAMVVFRRKHNIPGLRDWLPVALIRSRPKYKEQFYEICLKLSIYYQLRGNVLVDAAKPLVIQYFKDSGNEQYLASRPRKFESDGSKQSHEYGVLLTTFSRPKMAGCLQTLFDYHVDKIDFEYILNEGLNWDQNEVDSDNDTVDAIGIAIMRAIDMDNMPLNEDELMKGNPFEHPEFAEDSEGNIVPTSSREIMDKSKIGTEEDYVSFLHRSQGFNMGMSENNSSDDPFED